MLAVRITIGLTLLVVAARPAHACQCPENPACAAFWQADAVFTGVVVEVAPERLAPFLSWTVSRLAVAQTFRGTVGATVTMVPGARPSTSYIAASVASGVDAYFGGGSCDYRFEVGHRYVIYARRTADGEWTTSICSGTKLLDHASADLEYFASPQSARSGGSVLGRIERVIIDPDDHRRWKTLPATGVAVSLTRDGTQVIAHTDGEGRLEVDLPAGPYIVAPLVAPTMRYGASQSVTVPARGCAPFYFQLMANGRVEGRALLADGTPVSGVSVVLIPADPAVARARPRSSLIAPSAKTDESGRFDVGPVFPGRYELAVNADFGPSLSKPFATSYVPLHTQTQTIDLGEGERRTGLTVVVSPLREVSVSGVVILEGAGPVADVRVVASPYEYRGQYMDTTKTDESGAFRLRVLAGANYIIWASRTRDKVSEVEDTVFVADTVEGIRLTIRP